ncbi:MAG: FMN-binding protein [Spirochaetales bacterium]|nr:MAG: FMN-binding protein [Spirochaetales bacterium]
MKKIVTALTLLALVFATVSVSAQVTAKDGFYFSEAKAYSSSGWKEQVVIEVKGGKIVSVNWNGINYLGVPDKKTYAAAGGYGMAKAAKQGEWHVQAARAEAELIRLQDPAKIAIKSDGKTDAISGVTMTVKEFVDLAKVALSSAPVAKGTYKNSGWFFAKAPEFDKSGYAATALITIVNGRIVSANWNALNKAGGDSKVVRSIKGTYKMNAKQGEFHVQATRVEAKLIEVQDPAKITLKADGKTDAVSGVSITVNEFIAVAIEALKKAK